MQTSSFTLPTQIELLDSSCLKSNHILQVAPMTKQIALISQQLLRAGIALTFLSGGCAIWLSSQAALSPRQEIVFETSNNTWEAGTHIIFSLLGHGTAALLREEEE